MENGPAVIPSGDEADDMGEYGRVHGQCDILPDDRHSRSQDREKGTLT